MIAKPHAVRTTPNPRRIESRIFAVDTPSRNRGTNPTISRIGIRYRQQLDACLSTETSR